MIVRVIFDTHFCFLQLSNLLVLILYILPLLRLVLQQLSPLLPLLLLRSDLGLEAALIFSLLEARDELYALFAVESYRFLVSLLVEEARASAATTAAPSASPATSTATPASTSSLKAECIMMSARRS